MRNAFLTFTALTITAIIFKTTASRLSLFVSRSGNGGSVNPRKCDQQDDVYNLRHLHCHSIFGCEPLSTPSAVLPIAMTA
jgi:hypothetical protein